MRARHAKKRKDQKLSHENGRGMELKTIKHDEALKDLAGQLNKLLHKVIVKPSAKRVLDRNQYRIAICGQGMQRKGRTKNRVSIVARSWS